MTKLNRSAQTAPAQPAVPVAETPTNSEIVKFVASAPSPTRKAREKKDAEPKVNLVRKQDWFNAHFTIGDRSKVIQHRTYAARGGFKCAACSIPGLRSFLIESKDGTGRDLEVRDLNEQSKTFGEKIGEVRGYEVGYNCLKRYGQVDMALSPEQHEEQRRKAIETAKAVVASTQTEAAA